VIKNNYHDNIDSTYLTVDLKKVQHNYIELSKQFGQSIVSTVKSNCYGFGVNKIAEVFYDLNCKTFAVSTEKEALELRLLLGKNIDIIILNGYNYKLQQMYKDYDFIAVPASIEQLELLPNSQKSWVHFDSGINRSGIEFSQWNNANNIIKNKNVTTIISHLSHTISSTIEQKQLELAKDLFSIYSNYDNSFLKTSGLLIPKEYWFNNARMGHGLYFAYDYTNTKDIATMQTEILQTKYINSGDKVGYNGTFTAQKSMKIAIISCGYKHGLKQNHPYVIINNKQCKIIGIISMELTTIDITHLDPEDLIHPIFIFNNNWLDIGKITGMSLGALSTNINVPIKYIE